MFADAVRVSRAQINLNSHMLNISINLKDAIREPRAQIKVIVLYVMSGNT